MATTVEFNPLLALLKLVSGGAAGGGTTAASAATQTSPQLEAFLQAIPFANDGDVITPDHHNTLREAIGQIARALDASQFADVVTVSIPPALLPIIDNNPWRIDEGFSRGPDQFADAMGWLALDLPDGTSIDHVHVRGTAPTKPSQLKFTIVRKPVANPSSAGDEIVSQEVQEKLGQGGVLDLPIQPKTDGTPTQLADLRRVDNSKYLYLFTATLVAPNQTAASSVLLTLVEITCVRS
jgi:hypothetical protein